LNKLTAPLFCLLFFIASPALAVIETYEFSNEELELRYHQLSAELRCPKCQNQNIADSNAPIAKDLRQLLYKQLEEGASDQQILDYMVARYGDFVRYRPSFSGATAVLWLAPLLLLLAGLVVLALTLRGRRDPSAADRGGELSAEDSQRLQSLLDETEKNA
jgi:cytochrome c-type biogenesis protein CcmH